MIPQQWAPPCNNQCTHKYAALMQIPCLSECEEICYKNPVLKDQQWSAYIDRSPGAASCSEECFHACVAGCGYKYACRAKFKIFRSMDMVEEVSLSKKDLSESNTSDLLCAAPVCED